MKTFLAPNGEYINIPDNRITTFGLSDNQNQLISDAFPVKDCELFIADIPTDLVAISASTLIINTAALDKDGIELIFDYYTEIGNSADETVFWLGDIKPPKHLQTKFKCYENFEEIVPNLKYYLLAAHRKSKKAQDFSKRLADCLKILALIRSNPGIKTSELAEQTELSARTVQRYITTLEVAGEWIEYNTSKKGWQLQYGISVLFGDHLND